MLSSKKKPDIDVQKDGRVILRGLAYRRMKGKLFAEAGGRCESCGKKTLDGWSGEGPGVEASNQVS